MRGSLFGQEYLGSSASHLEVQADFCADFDFLPRSVLLPQPPWTVEAEAEAKTAGRGTESYMIHVHQVSLSHDDL